MIWAWIAAAVAISWLFCKKGISWYHYIWFLLPIEMYGVTIAGATLKPYMLFGICNAAYNVHSGFDNWLLLSAPSKRWY